jgi:Lon protease-like protein
VDVDDTLKVNAAMVTQLEQIGSLLDRQHGAILQVIGAITAIVAIGTLISWRMLTSLQAEYRAQVSLTREREMRKAYRGGAWPFWPISSRRRLAPSIHRCNASSTRAMR